MLLRWIAVAGVAAALLWVLGRTVGNGIPAFAAWVASHGVMGPVLFVLGYAVATVALVPASVLTLAAGAIFGLVRGTLLVLLGATLGSAGAFLVSRYLARPAVERRLKGEHRLERIDAAIAGHGFRIVFLLRLSPVFPFSLMNYALGVTRVRFADYLSASVGMIPGTLLYVYYGKAAGDVAALAAGSGAQRGAGYYTVLGLGLLATVAVTVLITRLARRALSEHTDNPTLARAD